VRLQVQVDIHLGSPSAVAGGLIPGQGVPARGSSLLKAWQDLADYNPANSIPAMQQA
jgi:hypothetical protein